MAIHPVFMTMISMGWAWRTVVLGLGLIALGCGGSGSTPKTEADFWLLNATDDIGAVSVDVPGRVRQVVNYGSSAPPHPLPRQVTAFNGEVVLRNETGTEVLDSLRLQADSETLTTVFVAGQAGGNEDKAELVPIQDARRSLDRNSMNLRYANLTRNTTVDLYIVPVGASVPDRSPDVAGLKPREVSALLKLPPRQYEVLATLPGSKTAITHQRHSDYETPGYWTWMLHGPATGKPIILASEIGSAF